MDDEESILPRKLQVALEHILEQRNDLAGEQDEGSPDSKHGKCSATSEMHLLSSSVRVRGHVDNGLLLLLAKWKKRDSQAPGEKWASASVSAFPSASELEKKCSTTLLKPYNVCVKGKKRGRPRGTAWQATA